VSGSIMSRKNYAKRRKLGWARLKTAGHIPLPTIIIKLEDRTDSIRAIRPLETLLAMNARNTLPILSHVTAIENGTFVRPSFGDSVEIPGPVDPDLLAITSRKGGG
jgi:hypothetical protein